MQYEKKVIRIVYENEKQNSKRILSILIKAASQKLEKLKFIIDNDRTVDFN